MARRKKRIYRVPWDTIPKTWELKRVKYVEDITIQFLDTLYAPITAHCTSVANNIALENQAIYSGAQSYFTYQGVTYGDMENITSKAWHDKLHPSLYNKIDELLEFHNSFHESINAVLIKAYIGNSLTLARQIKNLYVLLPAFFHPGINAISMMQYEYPTLTPDALLQQFIDKNQDGLAALKQQLAYNLIYSK